MGPSDEGDEGKGRHEDRWRHDPNSRACICGRDQWFEDQAGEGSRGGSYDGCMRSNQKTRKFQAGRHAQHEVEEEACHRGKEGHQPFHRGTLRLQGQASIEDCQSPCHEETQGGIELRMLEIPKNVLNLFPGRAGESHQEFWWAVPLSSKCQLYKARHGCLVLFSTAETK